MATTKLTPLDEVLAGCIELLKVGKFVVHFTSKPHIDTPRSPTTEQVAIEEAVNYLLWDAASKLRDLKRFNKYFSYILKPSLPTSLKAILDKATPREIFEFISPESEGFPEVDQKRVTCLQAPSLSQDKSSSVAAGRLQKPSLSNRSIKRKSSSTPTK